MVVDVEVEGLRCLNDTVFTFHASMENEMGKV